MFLSHNIVFKGKNQAKVMYFMKLAILIFGCPGDMHITNCTRMPQEEGGGCKSCQGSEAAALLGQARLCQQGKCQHSTFHYFGDYTCNQTLLSTKCFINGTNCLKATSSVFRKAYLRRNVFFVSNSRRD